LNTGFRLSRATSSPDYLTNKFSLAVQLQFLQPTQMADQRFFWRACAAQEDVAVGKFEQPQVITGTQLVPFPNGLRDRYFTPAGNGCCHAIGLSYCNLKSMPD